MERIEKRREKKEEIKQIKTKIKLIYLGIANSFFRAKVSFTKSPKTDLSSNINPSREAKRRREIIGWKNKK